MSAASAGSNAGSNVGSNVGSNAGSNVCSAGRRVMVVGGGVVGAACAYYLSKAGWTVTVLDRGAFGAGCSHGNCGFVCPSHVLPLATPGAVGRALRAMLSPNSPFTIKPRFDPSLWRWLLRFARRCNEHDMMRAGRAIQALLNSSRALYDELFTAEPFDCEWQTRGLLFALLTRAGMEHYAHTDTLLRESFGLGARRYDGDAVRELEPALKPGLAGGWHYTTDAHLRPDKLMASWRRVLAARGVTIFEHCEMTGFASEHGRARVVAFRSAKGRLYGPPPFRGAKGDEAHFRGAKGDNHEIPADAFVVATGAWTPLLHRHLGCRIPIQPGKGYSLTMPRPAKCPAIPLIFEEHRVAVTPMPSGYRLGSTMEFAGYDTTLSPRRLALLKDGARHYLEEPYTEPIEEAWFGWRPMTPDSLPIIDRSPALENVWIAAGHNMLGVSMAPATGRLVAEMLGGGKCHIDVSPYRVARF